MKQRLRAVCIIGLTCAVAFYSMGGCVESNALKVLAGTKGVIESEMHKHGECNPAGTPAKTPICTALNEAIPAQHIGVLALDAYCASDDYLNKQGKCLPPTDPAARQQLQTKLTQAVTNVQAAIATVKSISGGAQ